MPRPRLAAILFASAGLFASASVLASAAASAGEPTPPPPSLAALLRRAPPEVRRHVAPVARHVVPGPILVPGMALRTYHILDDEGQRVAFFSGDGDRMEEWTYYRGDDRFTLRDDDGDGYAEHRVVELGHDERLDLRRVQVWRAGGWRLESESDYRRCFDTGVKETTWDERGRARVRYSSCLTS